METIKYLQMLKYVHYHSLSISWEKYWQYLVIDLPFDNISPCHNNNNNHTLLLHNI